MYVIGLGYLMIRNFVVYVGHLVLLVNLSWFTHSWVAEVGNAHRILVGK